MLLVNKNRRRNLRKTIYLKTKISTNAEVTIDICMIFNISRDSFILFSFIIIIIVLFYVSHIKSAHTFTQNVYFSLLIVAYPTTKQSKHSSSSFERKIFIVHFKHNVLFNISELHYVKINAILNAKYYFILKQLNLQLSR